MPSEPPQRPETPRHSPAPRRLIGAEVSLAALHREHDGRPRCPELEHPRSKPITGVCPECGLASGSLQIGNQTWHYCDEHKVRWHTFNSHAGPHDLELWQANAEKLAAYRIVHPKKCVRPCGKPSLTQLSVALHAGIKRDREQAGLPA